MSDYTHWSTSSIVCAPFLDTDFDASERVAMLRELRRRGYPRALVLFLRVFAGVGLWWNLIVWEWADLNLTDVLLGYFLNFALAALVLAAVAFFTLVVNGSTGLFAILAVGFAALCLLLFFAASKTKKSRERAA